MPFVSDRYGAVTKMYQGDVINGWYRAIGGKVFFFTVCTGAGRRILWATELGRSAHAGNQILHVFVYTYHTVKVRKIGDMYNVTCTCGDARRYRSKDPAQRRRTIHQRKHRKDGE